MTEAFYEFGKVNLFKATHTKSMKGTIDVGRGSDHYQIHSKRNKTLMTSHIGAGGFQYPPKLKL